MRPRGKEEPPRSIFTREGSVTRDTSYRMMQEHQYKGRFLVHRIVLAPSDDERPEDLREMTRAVMYELEKDRGENLHWVAIEHRHTEHHHVHVMLFGGAETEAGVREVRLGRTDHSRLREEGGEYCRWEREEREGWEEAFSQSNARSHDLEDDVIPRRVGAEHQPEDESPQPVEHERGSYGLER